MTDFANLVKLKLKVNAVAVADVAQLVRAPGCGSGGRGFNSHHSPQLKKIPMDLFCISTDYGAPPRGVLEPLRTD